jgi:hypothetical protein
MTPATIRTTVTRVHRELVEAQRRAATWEVACSIAHAAESLVRLRLLPTVPTNDNRSAT